MNGHVYRLFVWFWGFELVLCVSLISQQGWHQSRIVSQNLQQVCVMITWLTAELCDHFACRGPSRDDYLWVRSNRGGLQKRSCLLEREGWYLLVRFLLSDPEKIHPFAGHWNHLQITPCCTLVLSLFIRAWKFLWIEALKPCRWPFVGLSDTLREDNQVNMFMFKVCHLMHSDSEKLVRMHQSALLFSLLMARLQVSRDVVSRCRWMLVER